MDFGGPLVRRTVDNLIRGLVGRCHVCPKGKP